MSLKPPKKSDLDKSWMKARRDKPKKINEGKLPSASAPGTKVYGLVKKLKPYLA